ncbi:MAG: SCO family protein [Rhodothermales bacterium]
MKALFLLAVLVLAGGAVALTSSPGDTARPTVAEPLSEASIYQLSSTWTTSSGRILALESLAGRPLLVAMVFTHCAFACPRIVDEIKSVLRDLPENGRPGVVLVSIDPERDTTEVMARFAEVHGLDEPQWLLLQGTETTVRELAAVLNVQYRRNPDGEFAHSNTITLLDAGGEISARPEGLDSDRTSFIESVRAGLRRVNQAG